MPDGPIIRHFLHGFLYDFPMDLGKELPMKRKTSRRILAAALCLLLLVPCFLMSASAASSRYILPETIKVGLFYASSSLTSANLENEVGYGYQLGCYDANDRFVALAETDEECISICIDENLYFKPGGGYNTFNSYSGNDLIGAYHVQMQDAYNTFYEAFAAAAEFNDGFVAYVNGAYFVRAGNYTSLSEASYAASGIQGAKAVGGSADCLTVYSTQTGRTLFEFDSNGEALAVEPYSPYAPGETWFRGYCYRGGFRYARSRDYNQGGKIAVTNFVPLEDYVAGVIPYELSASWPMEALKAGAICARSFAVAAGGNHQTFDVCDTTDCQVYHGVYKGANAENIDAAVNATRGVCAWYNGEPIKAVYSAGTGGYTESAKNTWSVEKGYLQAKLDEFDAVADYPGCAWTYVVTSAQVTSMLRAAGKSCGNIVGMAVTKWTEVGNVLEVTFVDAGGSRYTLTKDNVRLLGNINGVKYMSRRFTITPGTNTGKPATLTTVSDSGTSGGEAGSFTVYNGSDFSTSESIYVMTSDGLTQISGGAVCRTSAGVENLGSGTSTSVGSGSAVIRLDTSDQKSDLSYSTTWTLNGSGYGHNVGLSQWGARNMANLGYTCDEILHYYFTGIDVY